MRIDSSDAVLAEALDAYALTRPRVLGPHEASKRNDNFLVEDGDGARYILRRYRRNLDQARIDFQVEFQRELHKRGYPTSEVIAAKGGALSVASEAGPWVLFSYIEGDEYDFSRTGQVAEAGRRLAEFHELTSDIHLEEVVLDINLAVRRLWTHAAEDFAALEGLFPHVDVGDEMAFLRSWRDRFVARCPLAAFDALPRGWVHSDYHGRNMVFAGDELRGLFDFDPLHREVFVEDVGHAVFMFSREFRGSTRMRPDVARAFLEAYESVHALDKNERAVLPLMLPLVWVPSAPYHALLQRDGEDSLAFFRHYVQLMRELEVEAEKLQPLLS